MSPAANSKRKLLVGGHVVTVDKQRSVHERGYVAIEGSRILDVGPMTACPSSNEFDEVLDLEGMLVLPGLINAHQHHWYTLFKGLGEGLFLEDWFAEILLPLAQEMTADDLRVAGYLAGLEMLAAGTTTFLNHSVTSTTEDDVAASIEPFLDIGIRQIFCKELRVGDGRTETDAIRELESVLSRWDGSQGGLVRIGAVIETAAHFVRTGFTSDELIRMGTELAQRRRLRISNHITGGTVWRSIAGRIQAEGRSDVEHLMGLGVLGPNWVLVHCTWISDREIRMCSETGAHVVACPASGAYTAGGAAPIRTLLDAGVPVALGSDGPMVNSSVDMVEQMKITALIQNLRYLTPGVVSSEQLIEMVTIEGAEALGLASELGSLEPGKRADVIALDMRGWHWGVPLDPVSALVFAGRGTDARYVLIDGSWRVFEGQVVVAGSSASWMTGLHDDAKSKSISVVERAGLLSMLEAKSTFSKTALSHNKEGSP